MPTLTVTVKPYANLEQDPARSHWWIASCADGAAPMGAIVLTDASIESVLRAVNAQHATYGEPDVIYPDGEPSTS